MRRHRAGGARRTDKRLGHRVELEPVGACLDGVLGGRVARERLPVVQHVREEGRANGKRLGRCELVAGDDERESVVHGLVAPGVAAEEHDVEAGGAE